MINIKIIRIMIMMAMMIKIKILFRMLGSQQDPQEFVSYKAISSLHPHYNQHHQHYQNYHDQHHHYNQNHQHHQIIMTNIIIVINIMIMISIIVITIENHPNDWNLRNHLTSLIGTTTERSATVLCRSSILNLITSSARDISIPTTASRHQSCAIQTPDPISVSCLEILWCIGSAWNVLS